MSTFGALFLFSGLGGGALGFQRARAKFRGVSGQFRIAGAVDNSDAACRDFERLTGYPATPADISTMTPDELRAACGGTRPDVVFTSPPCKGFSGLLSAKKASTDKYQRLNRLVLQGLWLVLEAWPDDPPGLILLENVPRIAKRGRELLDQVQALLGRAGYVFSESFHDCGELGELGQRRRRFLMVARRPDRVPCYLYEPPRRRVRSIGEILEQLPLPDDPAGGPMHRLSRLQWRTWVRLALIPAGKDWRSLPGMEGRPDYRNYGVVPWDAPAATVTSARAPGQGQFSVADPRTGKWFGGAYGVGSWDAPSNTVTGRGNPSCGVRAVADPRLTGKGFHRNKYRVTAWDAPANTIIGAVGPGSGAPTVGDPCGRRFNNVYRVIRWDEPAVAVNAGGGPSSGAAAVADPRLGCRPRNGTLGVIPWDTPAPTVTASQDVHAGASAVADPRLPADEDRPDPPPIIIAEDGTWHRPLTTLELAALQGFDVLEADGALVLDGKAHGGWRERIGNAVPPPTAQAIAEQMLLTLLASKQEAWMLSSTDVWVEPEVRP